MPPSTPCTITSASAATPKPRTQRAVVASPQHDEQANRDQPTAARQQPMPVLDEQVPRPGEPRLPRIEEQVVAVRARPIGHGHAGVVRRHQPADPDQRKRRAAPAPPPADAARGDRRDATCSCMQSEATVAGNLR